MIFRSILMLSILASGTKAQAEKNVLQLNSGKNLKAARLLMNMAAVGDWTNDFIGQRTFELMDDPIYANQYQNLKNLEAELLRVRGMLNDKKLALDQTIANKNKKVADLQTTNKSLSEKNKLKTDTEKEIQLLTTDNTAQTNAISSNQNLITAQNDEVQKLTQELNFWKGEFDTSVMSVNSKQAAYDAALSACQTATPTADCTQDKDVIYAKTMLNQAVERKNYLETQRNAVAARLETANGKISKANADIKVAQKKIEDNVAKISTDNALVAKLSSEIPTLISQASSLTDEIKELSSQEVVLVDDVKRMTSIEQSQGASYQAALNGFENMRNDLINQITAFNRNGYDKSVANGSQEGIEIANNLGGKAGTNQGMLAGAQKGEADGRARDYRIGQEQGEGDGARDGKNEGSKVGILEGKQSGFKAAGSKEGEASGINKAIASDAQAVGRNLGNQSGMQKAIDVGHDEGYTTGEAQAIQDQENDILANSTVGGQFAGTFASNLPGFPGSTGKYFNNSMNNARRVLQLAYVAGYNVGYAPAAEKVYYENVQAIYEAAYRSAYPDAYNRTFGVTYEDSLRQGRGAQYAAAYDREYKQAYTSTYKPAFDQAINNPDRQGSIFINAFKTSEASAYAAKYQQIKSSAFEDAEENSFNQNIASQTEKFRLQRFAQVSKIYQNFPVLKFISSLQDAGVRGVAAGDDFFMPGEDVVHNLTIANYGSTPATGAKVVLKNGETYSLPTIAAKSVVTIRGAGKEKIAVTQEIGSTISTNLVTKFSLSAQEKEIQGRHFSDSADGSMNPGDSKNLKVDYPIAVSNLSLAEPLVIRKDIALRATINNRSQKDFTNLTLELDSNLDAISQKFSKVDFLDQSVTKSDAMIRVSRDEDALKDIQFNLLVKVGDVLVGKVMAAGKDFVRVPYRNLPGAPVIALSSGTQNSRELLKDLVAELGGFDKVSILDLAAFNENQMTLDTKMSGKTVIAIDQDRDSIFPRMGGLAKTGNTSVVVITEGPAANSMQVLKSMMTDATSLNVKVDNESLQVVSTTPILTEGLAQKTSFIGAKFRNLESALKLATVTKLNDDSLLAKIASEISKDSFTTRTEKDVLLTKVLGLRVLEDALQINKAFADASKGKERRAWKKRQANDESLIVAKIQNRLEKSSGTEQVAMSMVSIPVGDSIEALLENSNMLESKIAKATKKAVGDYASTAKKNLKKSSPGLFDSVKQMEETFFAGF